MRKLQDCTILYKSLNFIGHNLSDEKNLMYEPLLRMVIILIYVLKAKRIYYICILI